jgi:hypothetical protein
MNRNPMLLSLAMAAVLGVGGGGRSSYYRPREFTLDEEEEQSVHRMLNRARARRRAMARAEITERELAAVREAAAKEAARPKSRQELRFAARKKAKRLREDRCVQKGERRP